jgi:hypothetical protein
MPDFNPSNSQIYSKWVLGGGTDSSMSLFHGRTVFVSGLKETKISIENIGFKFL